MLIGEYQHKLDPKKRLSLPAKLRRELGEKVVVTHGLDRCLFVYPLGEWQTMTRKLASLSVGASEGRGFNRFFLAGAVETEIDSLGRILIPDFLKTFAGLREAVVIIGVHSRLEIWEPDNWRRYKEDIVKEADKMASRLGELGLI